MTDYTKIDHVAYIHGTSPEEQQRLAALNRISNAAFLQYLELAATDRVLEVGSGLGLLTIEVSGRATAGSVVGLERSEEQLIQARANAARLAPQVQFVAGDAHALPFPSESFDVVYCRYLLEHVADPVKVLSEMRRVLRPSGKAFVQENDIRLARVDPPSAAFERAWGQFVTLQRQMGGDATIGAQLFRLMSLAGLRGVRLASQPELHWHGSEQFVSWVTNLQENLRGAAAELVSRGMASTAELEKALNDLESLKSHEQGSATFHWDRASGIR